MAGVSFNGLTQPELWLQDANYIREVRNFMITFQSLADLYAVVTDLEGRVQNLETRVTSLESFAAATDSRLLNIEQAVARLDARVTALEAWKQTVESRLAEIELRLDLIEALGVPYAGVPLPKKEDRDEDDIDDRVERLLIDAFSPVFMIDDAWRPPVSAEWFVQHAYLRGPNEDPDDFTASIRNEWTRRRAVWKHDPYQFIPEYERLVAQAKQSFPETDNTSWRLQLDSESFRDGNSDIGDRMSWDRAKREGNVGMYAHVVRGNNNTNGQFAGEYIIQYFMLLTWNETSYSFGIGNHEGDWACATLFVNLPEWAPQTNANVLLTPQQLTVVLQALENPSRTNRIITARLCNHGRYIDARGDKVDAVDIGNALGNLRGGIKPRFWMEGGTHELWPNSGGRGYAGWPGVKWGNSSQPPPTWQPLGPFIAVTNEANRILASTLLDHPLYRDGKIHKDTYSPGGFFGGASKYRPPWSLVADGFRISWDHGEGEDFDAINEHKICRGHSGHGGAYVTHSIPNLGEILKEFSKSAELVLRYRGFWGGWWSHNESPPGPWKEEMWIGPDPSNGGSRKAAQIDPLLRR